jgi:succinate dehydrogenase/fumarate reductase-like Fe-S protein
MCQQGDLFPQFELTAGERIQSVDDRERFDDSADERLEILNDREGVWRCRTIFNCTEARSASPRPSAR